LRAQRAFIGNLIEEIRGSLWFLPMLFVLTGVAAGLIVPIFERGMTGEGETGPLGLTVSPSAARTLLGTIAGSLVTVVALVFSVTFLALQQAATRYSPRIVGNFLSDRINQIVLGVYLATFTHAILVMAQVREEVLQTGLFVPTLSVGINVVLALACLAAFIVFMHHISESLQVSHILNALANELGRCIDRYTEEANGAPNDPNRYDVAVAVSTHGLGRGHHAVGSKGSGYLRRIDKAHLFAACGPDAEVVQVVPRVGQFVQTGSLLVRVWGETPDDLVVQNAFVLGKERSLAQDPLFGIDLLVDIGLRALSPGINDPITAIQCVDRVGDGLTRLGRGTLPPSTVSSEEGATFIFNEPQFQDFVDAGIGPLRRAPANLEVLAHLLTTIQGLVSQLDSNFRKAAFRPHVEGTIVSIGALQIPETDKEPALELGERVLQLLPGRSKGD
jgi:uncharacterized membrane protein